MLAKCPKCGCRVQCHKLDLADDEETILDSPCHFCIEKENEYKKEMWAVFRESFLAALHSVKDGLPSSEVRYCINIALEAVKQWKSAQIELIKTLEETK